MVMELIECDGYPGQNGCGHEIEKRRTNWKKEGMKRNGWYVTHATDDDKSTPTVPLYLLYFCPSCSVIVHTQEIRMALLSKTKKLMEASNGNLGN